VGLGGSFPLSEKEKRKKKKKKKVIKEEEKIRWELMLPNKKSYEAAASI
jgi:hypothetical protein